MKRAPVHALVVAVPRSPYLDEGRTRGTNDVPYPSRRPRALRIALERLDARLVGLFGPDAEPATFDGLLAAITEAVTAARADGGRLLLAWSGRAWRVGDDTRLALPAGELSTHALAEALAALGAPPIDVVLDTLGRVDWPGADAPATFRLRPADRVVHLADELPADGRFDTLERVFLETLAEPPGGQVGAEENDYASWTPEGGGATVCSALVLLVSGAPLTGPLHGMVRLERNGLEEWWIRPDAPLPEQWRLVSFQAEIDRWGETESAARFRHDTWAQEGYVRQPSFVWAGFGTTPVRVRPDQPGLPPTWVEVAGAGGPLAQPEVVFYLKVARDAAGRVTPDFARERWWASTPDVPKFVVSGPTRLLFRAVPFQAERLLYPAR